MSWRIKRSRPPRRILNTGRWSVGEVAALYLRHATINASEHPSAQRLPLVFVDERARVHIHDSVLDGAYSVRGLVVEHGAFVELHATIIFFCAATKGNGGGLLVNNSGVSLSMSAITNNGAANDGGAIHLTGEGSLLHVRGSVFEYNVVRSNGAAIFVGGGVSVDVLDSYFATNAAHGVRCARGASAPRPANTLKTVNFVCVGRASFAGRWRNIRGHVQRCPYFWQHDNDAQRW